MNNIYCKSILVSTNEYLPIANAFQSKHNTQTVGFYVADSSFTREAFKWQVNLYSFDSFYINDKLRLYLCLHTKDCTNFVDPLHSNALDTANQIIWRSTSSKLFGRKQLAVQMGFNNGLTPNSTNTTLQRYHAKISELYNPFLF